MCRAAAEHYSFSPHRFTTLVPPPLDRYSVVGLLLEMSWHSETMFLEKEIVSCSDKLDVWDLYMLNKPATVGVTVAVRYKYTHVSLLGGVMFR